MICCDVPVLGLDIGALGERISGNRGRPGWSTGGRRRRGRTSPRRPARESRTPRVAPATSRPEGLAEVLKKVVGAPCVNLQYV
ncbi:MAG: hypothetical protein MZW92_14755, partial [Comamonadaceae bacterium]|nr:hypothetical protein [Comamonadaceae bacterium]